jgi:hypothetical protein
MPVLAVSKPICDTSSTHTRSGEERQDYFDSCPKAALKI